MNRNVHVPVAVVTAFADLAIEPAKVPISAAEMIGRLLGGAVGGRLPDMIDPPTHPGHRGIGHAIVPAIVVALLLLRSMPGWQVALRERASQLRCRVPYAPQDAKRKLAAEAMICEFLLGMSVGVPLGYASHLSLDATTPAGLPWFNQEY